MFERKKFKIVLIFLSAFLMCGAAGARVHEMATALPQGKHIAAQQGHWDYQGVIHWHTSYSSDCTGTYADIAKVANAQNVDFMIATEHNNLDAVKDKREGIYGKTLMLSGVEITRPHVKLKHNSYMLGMNLKQYDGEKTDSTEDILSETAAQNGIVFVAHPQNPRWKWEGAVDDERITGMEILDKSDEWFTANTPDILRGIFYYPFSARIAFLQLFHRPAKTLSFWDKILDKRTFVGIYAPDFHQAVHLPFHTVLRFPKVDDILPIAHDHIVTQEPMRGDFLHDKALVYNALKAGQIYVAVDGLADATGFMFTASRGKKNVWMGQGFAGTETTAFNISLPAAGGLSNVITTVYQDGQAFEHYTGNDSYSFKTDKPGVYRVEVSALIPTFWGGSRRMIWIYSNPIYVGKKFHPAPLPFGSGRHTAMRDVYTE